MERRGREKDGEKGEQGGWGRRAARAERWEDTAEAESPSLMQDLHKPHGTPLAAVAQQSPHKREGIFNLRG